MKTASLNLTKAAIFGGTYNGGVVEGWHFLYQECEAKELDAYKKLVADAVANTVIELDEDCENVIYCSYDDISSHKCEEEDLFCCCEIPEQLLVEEFEKMLHRND